MHHKHGGFHLHDLDCEGLLTSFLWCTSLRFQSELCLLDRKNLNLWFLLQQQTEVPENDFRRGARSTSNEEFQAKTTFRGALQLFDLFSLDILGLSMELMLCGNAPSPSDHTSRNNQGGGVNRKKHRDPESHRSSQ